VVCTNWFAKQSQESDLSPVIVYRSHNGSIWTRPKAVFFEMVEVDGVLVPRFAAIDDDEVHRPAPQSAVSFRILLCSLPDRAVHSAE
jgi:hypothetical protein